MVFIETNMMGSTNKVYIIWWYL